MGEYIGRKTIVVMPVANEGRTIADVFEIILSLYDDIFIYPVIDKRSKDNTEQIIDTYSYASYERVRKIWKSRTSGLAACYICGIKAALESGATYIIEMNAGMRHDPRELPLFIDKLNEGYDCVFSTRFSDGGSEIDTPMKRRLISKGGTIFSNIVLGTKLSDMTGGYSAFNAKVLRNMDLDSFLSKGRMFQTEMRYYCRNFNCVEVPITYRSSGNDLKPGTVKKAFKTLFKIKDNEDSIFSGK